MLPPDRTPGPIGNRSGRWDEPESGGHLWTWKKNGELEHKSIKRKESTRTEKPGEEGKKEVPCGRRGPKVAFLTSLSSSTFYEFGEIDTPAQKDNCNYLSRGFPLLLCLVCGFLGSRDLLQQQNHHHHRSGCHILSGTYFTDNFKNFIFSPTPPLSFIQVFFLTITHHQNKTRHSIPTNIGTWCVVSAPQLLFRTLLVHVVTEILHLCVDTRQAQVPKLNVQSPLCYLHRNRRQRGRLPINSKAMNVLLNLDRLQVPDHSVQMTQNRQDLIGVHHQCGQLELV